MTEPETIAEPPLAISAAVPPPTASEVTQATASSQDYVVLRFAVLGLTLVGLIALVGVIVLAWRGKNIPEGLLAIVAGPVTALATMLVRPPLFPPVQPRSSGTDRRQS